LSKQLDLDEETHQRDLVIVLFFYYFFCRSLIGDGSVEDGSVEDGSVEDRSLKTDR